MIRLGMIGCGGIATHHANMIENVPSLKVAAAADIHPKARKLFAETFNVEMAFSYYNKMLREASLDAVAVALPTYLHRGAVVAAAKAGLHVFCEKPIAMTLPDARAMIRACEKADVNLLAGFVRRFDADWATFRKLVQSSRIGRPVIWRQFLSGCGAPMGWYYDAQKGGGPFMDGCAHNYDFAHSVFGRAVSVVASLSRLKPSTALDTGTVCIRYEKGDEMHLSWSWGLPDGVIAASGTDALGPKGSIRFPGSYPADLLGNDFDAEKYGAYLVTQAGGKNKAVRYPLKDMYIKQWRHFAECIRRDRRPLVSGPEAYEAQRVACAVLKAAQTGKKVTL